MHYSVSIFLNLCLPVVSPEEDSDSVNTESDGAALYFGDNINVTWNPLAVSNNILETNEVKVDVTLWAYKESEDNWKQQIVLASDVPNSGKAFVHLPEVNSTDADFELALIKVSPSVSSSTKRALKLIRVLNKLGKWTKARVIGSIKSSVARRLACEAWNLVDRGVDLNTVPPCPCRKDQATNDDRYEQEKGVAADFLREHVFHKGSESCFRQANARYALQYYFLWYKSQQITVQ